MLLNNGNKITQINQNEMFTIKNNHLISWANWQHAYRAHRFKIGFIASTEVAACNVAVPVSCAVTFTGGP